MAAQYQPLKDLVYDYITSKITSGELAAGDRIPEPMICDALDISRTPVREALIRLSADGYLESLPRKGFRVKGVSQESAEAIYQIIGPLDGEAAYLATPHLEARDFQKMEFLINSIDLCIQSEMFDRYDELQREFHHSYIDKCENTRLVLVLEEQEKSFMRQGYCSLESDKVQHLLTKANTEHKEIFKLLKHEDGEGARRYIRDVHWDVKNACYWVW